MSASKLQALKLKYEADIAMAQATLEIYVNSSVGIGEHPQHLEEMDTLIGNMAEARDKLEEVNSILRVNQTLSESNQDQQTLWGETSLIGC